LAAKLHQLTGGEIVAHDTIEFSDAIKGGMGRGFGSRFACGVDHDADARPHVIFGEFKPRRRLGDRCRYDYNEYRTRHAFDS
jgi:hypothetical protein